MPTPRQEIAKYASQSQLSNIFTDYMGILNAKIYGAVGDGVTSDSSNLQLAVNAANDSSAYAIFLPQGSYSCTGLSSDANIIWWGDNASFTGGYAGTVKQLGDWIDPPASTPGDIVYFASSSEWTNLPKGTTGQVLSMSSDGTPQWANGVLSPSGTTLGDILYRDASSQWVQLARGTTDQFLGMSSDSVPAWGTPAGIDKTYRVGHTYTISGLVSVASSDVDYINPFFISFASGQTASISKCRHALQLGTNITAKLQKNSSDMTGFTDISVTTDPASTTAAAVSLADDDKIALIVTATSGSPTNLAFTIFVDYSQ